MKCAKCGADIYKGVLKCPYCKTLTEAGEEGKFKNFDFKYTISLSDQKKIEDTAREGSNSKAKFRNTAKNKVSWLKLPKLRRKSDVQPKNESFGDTTGVGTTERISDTKKSEAQRAAEFVPEGMTRYTVRGMNGEEVRPVNTETNYDNENLSEYTRIKHTQGPIKEPRQIRRRSSQGLKRRSTRRRSKGNSNSIDRKIVAVFCAAVLCLVAIIMGVSALSIAVSKNSSVATPYTYIKDNAMYMVYKNKTVKLSDAVIADAYIRNIDKNDSAVSAERAAKDANIVKTAENGKRTYFFENYNPETGSGVLKYINKGRTRKIKEISQAVHNSIVYSKDSNELLYLATTDPNGDMGVLYYWNDKMDEPFEIATDIDQGTFAFADDNGYAVFLQNLNRVEMKGDLYIKSLEKLKDEKIKIDSDVCSLFGTNPGKKAFVYGKDYDKTDNSFDIYAINKKGKTIRLGERTKKAPLMQKTKDKLFVYGMADDGTSNLYSVEIETGKKEKIASGVSNILMLSKDEKTVIYDKVYTGKLADYYAYTKGNQPVKVAGNVVVSYDAVGGKPQMAVTEDCSKILYISEFEGFKGGGTLNLCEYKNGKVVSEKQISEDVYSVYRAENGMFIVNKDYSVSHKVFDSYLLKKDELTLIKEEIHPEMFGVSKTGDNILCITGYGVEGNFGSLEKINLKGKSEEIAKQVFGFTNNDDDILFYKNLNTEDGNFDLYLKRGNKKVIDVDTSVMEILN